MVRPRFFFERLADPRRLRRIENSSVQENQVRVRHFQMGWIRVTTEYTIPQATKNKIAHIR